MSKKFICEVLLDDEFNVKEIVVYNSETESYETVNRATLFNDGDIRSGEFIKMRDRAILCKKMRKYLVRKIEEEGSLAVGAVMQEDVPFNALIPVQEFCEECQITEDKLSELLNGIGWRGLEKILRCSLGDEYFIKVCSCVTLHYRGKYQYTYFIGVCKNNLQEKVELFKKYLLMNMAVIQVAQKNRGSRSGTNVTIYQYTDIFNAASSFFNNHLGMQYAFLYREKYVLYQDGSFRNIGEVPLGRCCDLNEEELNSDMKNLGICKCLVIENFEYSRNAGLLIEDEEICSLIEDLYAFREGV